MSTLSSQSIRKLCTKPLITPFSDQRHVVNGKSWGLGPASYDLRIAHDLTLGAYPGVNFALATTIEKFCLPDNVVGSICDKSSYARVFVSAFNTLFDPGFEGDAVLELVNHGNQTIHIKAGDPICQISFQWLDEPTDRPYRGKYQEQLGIQGAIHEKP